MIYAVKHKLGGNIISLDDERYWKLIQKLLTSEYWELPNIYHNLEWEPIEEHEEFDRIYDLIYSEANPLPWSEPSVHVSISKLNVHEIGMYHLFDRINRYLSTYDGDFNWWWKMDEFKEEAQQYIGPRPDNTFDFEADEQPRQVGRRTSARFGVEFDVTPIKMDK